MPADGQRDALSAEAAGQVLRGAPSHSAGTDEVCLPKSLTSFVAERLQYLHVASSGSAQLDLTDHNAQRSARGPKKKKKEKYFVYHTVECPPVTSSTSPSGVTKGRFAGAPWQEM